MQTDSAARHPSFCALIDKSSWPAQPRPPRSNRCANTWPPVPRAREHLEATRRAIAGMEGFPFAVGPSLDNQVLAAIAVRAQQLETNRIRRRQMGWSALLALVLTAVGSLAASRVGSLAAPALHLDAAQMRFGLVAFWITPSVFVCLLLLLLPASLHQWSSKEREVS